MMQKYLNSLLLITCCLLAAMLSITRYADFDLWWHVKLGEIVANTGRLFALDTFSYTYAGLHQYTGEWLADLCIYSSFAIGGLAGVNYLKALVLLIMVLFLQKAINSSLGDKRSSYLASAITVVIILFAIRFRLFVRPYLFSMLFASCFIFILERMREKSYLRSIFMIPIIEALWANMSVGAIFGPLILLCYLVEDCFITKNNIKRNVLIFTATFVASLMSSETYHIYTLTLNLFTDPYKAVVGEYQPMSTRILWGFGLRYTWAYQILTASALLYFLLFKGWKRISHLLLFAFFFLETLLQVRMIELFALVVAPMSAVPVEKALSFINRRPEAHYRIAVTVLASIIIATAIGATKWSSTYQFGNGMKQDAFPEEALSFLDREGIQGVMFNGYSIGGFTIWRSPHRKVFIDGRYRRLYSSDFYREYSAMLDDTVAWKAAEERYGFEYALVEYDKLSMRFPLHLNSNPNWALVYWDNHSAVYLKRIPRYAAIIAAHEYRVAKPNFYDFSYLKKTGMTSAQMLHEIDRDIDLNPNNQEPILAKALLLYEQGSSSREEVMRLLRQSMDMKPDVAMKHSAMAYLLNEQGKLGQAKVEVKKALSLDPLDLGAWELGKKLGIELEIPKGAHP